MGTTAQKLQAILDSKADIASAIEEKGGTVPTKLAEYGDAIRNIPAGTEELADVEFIDYDGTIVAKYTTEEALALTELPALPEPKYDWLTNQGWNYTYEEFIQQVQDSGHATVGCTYCTTGGETHIIVTIPDASKASTSVYFRIMTSGTRVSLDWGDGNRATYTAPSNNYNVAESHTYSPDSYPATYTITITPVDGANFIFPNNIFKRYSETLSDSTGEWEDMKETGSILSEIWLGSSAPTQLGTFFIANSVNIEAVSIPNISGQVMWSYPFMGCTSLKCMVVPKNVIAGVGNDRYASVPENFAAFCSSIEKISLPADMTEMYMTAFKGCTSLRRVDFPYSMTKLDHSRGNFAGCASLESVSIPTALTRLGDHTFFECGHLTKVNLPASQTSPIYYNNCFEGCASLESIILPEGLTEIQEGLFYGCASLKYVKMPSTLTKIYTKAFWFCLGLGTLDFTACTAIPELVSTAAFEGLFKYGNNLKILVPSSLYSNWVGASNWSSFAARIVADE